MVRDVKRNCTRNFNESFPRQIYLGKLSLKFRVQFRCTSRTMFRVKFRVKVSCHAALATVWAPNVGAASHQHGGVPDVPKLSVSCEAILYFFSGSFFSDFS